MGARPGCPTAVVMDGRPRHDSAGARHACGIGSQDVYVALREQLVALVGVIHATAQRAPRARELAHASRSPSRPAPAARATKVAQAVKAAPVVGPLRLPVGRVQERTSRRPARRRQRAGTRPGRRTVTCDCASSISEKKSRSRSKRDDIAAQRGLTVAQGARQLR